MNEQQSSPGILFVGVAPRGMKERATRGPSGSRIIPKRAQVSVGRRMRTEAACGIWTYLRVVSTDPVLDVSGLAMVETGHRVASVVMGTAAYS